jgi:hypothetical protein
MANPMVVTLDGFNSGRNTFTASYFMANCDAGFGGQDLQVPWAAFSTVVNNFINTYNVPPASVAIRFVHCFDTNTNELYLRMQICRMTPTATPKVSYLVTDPCAWYTIEGGNIQATACTDLFDVNYLNSMYYCTGAPCNAASLRNLANDIQGVAFVRNVTFPWSTEILQMYTDNGMPPGAMLCFAATSYGGGTAAAPNPHTVTIYLRDNAGNPMLDNAQYPGTDFKMKAGDMGTMCPNCCGVYVIP